MSNYRLYQSKIKNEFLKSYDNKSTRETYYWIFDKIYPFESKYGKDLLDFNLEELKDFFVSSRKFNKSTSEYYLKFISRYMEWAIHKGEIKKINRNYLQEIGIENFAESCAQVHQDYLTFEEIEEIVGKEGPDKYKFGFPVIPNIQDKLLIYLLFWGVSMKDRFYELINIKYEDVDFKKERITLTNYKGEERTLQMDSICMNLILQSRHEKEYVRYQDAARDYNNTKESYDLENSKYIFRRSVVGQKSSKSTDNKIQFKTIRRRIENIGKLLGLQLNATTIRDSGMLYKFKMMIDKGMEVTHTSAQTLIFERFRGSDTYQGQLNILKKLNRLLPKIYPHKSNLENNSILDTIIDNEQLPTDNEPPQSDFLSPNRVTTIVTRIIRDTNLVRELKAENEFICQICGSYITLPNGKRYAEGHHLQPLGGIHRGPDVKNNIIIVCPTHHAELDYGSIAVNPNTLLIEHIDSTNKFNTQKLAYFRKDINRKYLDYHYSNLFN